MARIKTHGRGAAAPGRAPAPRGGASRFLADDDAAGGGATPEGDSARGPAPGGAAIMAGGAGVNCGGSQSIDAMSTPAQKKARLDAGATAFSQAVVENLQCPITSALFVRPVCAEDGRTYEKAAIERWLSSKQRSPLTNEPMGMQLMDSMTTRALVESAIENGAVDDDVAATWHLESAKAKATGLLPGSIKDHLLRANALSPSKEIQLMLQATELKSRMDDLESEKQALLAESATEEIAAILGEASPVVPDRTSPAGPPEAVRRAIQQARAERTRTPAAMLSPPRRPRSPEEDLFGGGFERETVTLTRAPPSRQAPARRRRDEGGRWLDWGGRPALLPSGAGGDLEPPARRSPRARARTFHDESDVLVPPLSPTRLDSFASE